MKKTTAVYAVASGCPTSSAGSKFSSVLQLPLAHLISRYIRRETAQEKFPDQVIHGMARDTDQAIG